MAPWFRKWLADLPVHMTASPSLVSFVLLKPSVFGDLDLVLIPALAHNIRVLSLDRYASVGATALSLAELSLDIAHVQLKRWPAVKSLSSCLEQLLIHAAGVLVGDGSLRRIFVRRPAEMTCGKGASHLPVSLA